MKCAIWTEASSEIGVGHLVRMISIAKALDNEGVKCVFFGFIQDELKRLISSFDHTAMEPKFSSLDGLDSFLLSRKESFDWLIVDTPFLNSRESQSAPVSWRNTLLVDDLGASVPPCVTAVLNPNYGAKPEQYASARCDLLLGEEYILLRPDILSIAPRTAGRSGDLRVLVSMGGADPHDLTKKAGDSLIDVRGIDVTVVCGPANPRFNEYARRYGAVSHFTVLNSVDDMGRLLEWADVAVIAAGGTLWEALYAGCRVISLSINEIQASILRNLERLGELCYLGDGKKSLDRSVRQRLIDAVLDAGETLFRSRLVDGKGVSRVVTYLRGQ